MYVLKLSSFDFVMFTSETAIGRLSMICLTWQLIFTFSTSNCNLVAKKPASKLLLDRCTTFNSQAVCSFQLA